jgi:hypothetical protein
MYFVKRAIGDYSLMILFLFVICQYEGCELDTLHYLFPIQIAFFSRLSLPSRNPKQQTVE